MFSYYAEGTGYTWGAEKGSKLIYQCFFIDQNNTRE
jgi:hypothetical protein